MTLFCLVQFLKLATTSLVTVSLTHCRTPWLSVFTRERDTLLLLPQPAAGVACTSLENPKPQSLPLDAASLSPFFMPMVSEHSFDLDHAPSSFLPSTNSGPKQKGVAASESATLCHLQSFPGWVGPQATPSSSSASPRWSAPLLACCKVTR